MFKSHIKSHLPPFSFQNVISRPQFLMNMLSPNEITHALQGKNARLRHAQARQLVSVTEMEIFVNALGAKRENYIF